MQKQILKSFISVLFLTSCAFGVELHTDTQKESYSIGASTGGHIANQILGHKKLGVLTDVDALVQGFIDGLKKQNKLSDDEILNSLNKRADALNKANEAIKKAELDKNKKASKDFMNKNAKNKNVKTTASGLQYEILKAGKGEKPKPESIVLVNYRAYLPNGEVFEDSYKAKTSVTLSLITVIEGLKEGLVLMNTGSTYKFVIPSELAYGDEDVDVIPAGSAVVFEVELLQVGKPGTTFNKTDKNSEDNKSSAKQ
ncbi:FKBP-type peptidyl-prolyl cis-trans isomerase [Campylobacter sp. faydin G-105]|uniref:FKBP-type peptidyl-prolyl cis-trans isomerase N-terminal domain-containing protein n=1 Tax=Campylobacter anatolicus TaxID=2829105 RepID=UPI001B97B070|nr:FKBP-type peptidyl-prolyl cis-trans isomerase N-terminal domain-containing protein [Campylobacter anatolicus]MBR8461325.1 FKBP-type peptidyl-prolyl cis-trans isomerase [Campylobacter anatolicus]